MKKLLLLFLTLILAAASVFAQEIKTIHVYVALCDNKYQGIVPVPASIGNGQEARNNLYWGAGFGVKNFFDKKSTAWSLVKEVENSKNEILQSLLFKHKTKEVYLLAEAYDGQYIKQCTIDFISAMNGNDVRTILINGKSMNFGGGSNVVTYTGHNGLMDFDIEQSFTKVGDDNKGTIILACYSRNYFTEYVRAAEAIPLVWSTHLMSPEAYTLEAALNGWVNQESNDAIRERAAQAYNKYQKCGIKGARGLLKTGF